MRRVLLSRWILNVGTAVVWCWLLFFCALLVVVCYCCRVIFVCWLLLLCGLFLFLCVVVLFVVACGL